MDKRKTRPISETRTSPTREIDGRHKKYMKLDLLPFKDRKKNRFRALALAMKFERAMNVTGKKYNNYPDIEDAQVDLLKTKQCAQDRFKKVVEMILVMIKVIKVFSAHASATGRPVLIGQLYNDEGEIPQHPAFFEPKHFALRKFQYHIDPEARRILQLPWTTRTQENVDRVGRALRHCRAFRNLTQSMQHTMAKYARYESHEKNRTIVRKGDPGRHYYFIFSGQVLCMNSDVSDLDSAVVLGPGADFGHVALLHMEKRSSTVMCTEDTEFIVLDSRGNERAVFRALHMEHRKKRQFLGSLELFDGLDKLQYRCLADHARITEYLPTSLVATVSVGHPLLYIIIEGTANVALKTDLYSCCIPDEAERRQYLNQRRQCTHNKELLHDIFTQHDPTITCVIQVLSEKQMFGVQHAFHKKAKVPTLHLIARSRLIVLTLPIFSVLHYASNNAVMMLQERYPVYPSIKDLMCEYMESSLWDLYKAHIIRELLHPEGRVDPRKRCKYCISCQLRSLKLPNIVFDALRQDVSDLYCPGHISPLPALARNAFRVQSAPPQYAKVKKGIFRSHNPTPNLKTPDPSLRNTPDLHNTPDLPKLELKAMSSRTTRVL